MPSIRIDDDTAQRLDRLGRMIDETRPGLVRLLAYTQYGEALMLAAKAALDADTKETK